MRVFVEGPQWSGMWTEVVADALGTLGWETACHYHNIHGDAQGNAQGYARGLRARLSSRAARLTARHPWLPALGISQAERSNAALRTALARGGWDVLLSIQGKIDRRTIDAARTANPGLRVVFWWGDILTDRGRDRILELAPDVDAVLVSYRGDLDALGAAGVVNARLFLFGVSPRYHVPDPGHGTPPVRDVVLIGTCYPERCAAVEALNRHLPARVEVWGRSWRRCRGARARAALSLAEAQRVHASARIALNIHHRDTRDGMNMKYFEIPAAGALQIVDHQPLMDEPAGDRGVVTYRDQDELIERVRYFLAHEDERAERAAEARRRVLAADLYAPRLARALEQ